MKKILYLCVALALFTHVQAQNVTINPSGITPVPTHPRLSYDAILALPNPQEGDIAFDTTNKCLRIYIEGRWLCSYQDPKNYASIAPIIAPGGTGADTGQDIAVDNNGNIYITGTFTGTIQFGAISKTSAGSSDIFIAKYNSSGVVQWVKSAGGENGESATSIAIDGGGNVYVTGSHSGEATFESTTLSTYGGTDIFVVKYNTSGVFQWVKAAGGEQNDAGLGIAVDNSGVVYLTGSYIDYAHFGASITINAAGESDIFIAKMDNTGTFQWVQTAGGENKDLGKDIIADNTGVYLTGSFESTAAFGAINKTATGLADMFLAKYNTSGVAQWVKSGGGTADDHGNGLAIDGSGNVYLAGQFYGTATFDATTIGTGIANTYEISLAKYNNSGTLQWAQSAGGTGFDSGSGVAVFGSNVYLTGFFTNSATFGANTVSGYGDFDIFIAKYNSSGVCQWVQAAGGTAQDYGNNITVDSTGKAYIIGNYVGTATFGQTTKTAQGLSDVFVSKVD